MVEIEKKREPAKGVVKLLSGVGVLVIGAVCAIVFWPQLRVIVAGLIGPFLILAGLVMIAVAKE